MLENKNGKWDTGEEKLIDFSKKNYEIIGNTNNEPNKIDKIIKDYENKK